MSRMPALLLPNTASPFAPRSSPTIVLNTKVDPWLTATLKRINRIKRSLNSVPQHMKCLTETLSQQSAIWNLCTLMVPKAPASQLDRHDNPLVEAFARFELLHVQAYVVHIDLVLSHEVAFKLTKDTIDDLCEYHKDIYLVDQTDTTWPWTEKEAQVKKLHDEFHQAVNKYVYRTDAIALEGLEDDGAGELLCGRSEDVKAQVLALFYPLMPPPPRVVDVVRPVAQMLPSNPGNWWNPSPVPSNAPPPPPVESWKILPSSPIEDNSPVSSSGGFPTIWGPTTGYDMPVTCSPGPQYTQAPTTLSMSIPQLPLPSMVAQQCSVGSGFGGFGWDRYQDYGATM
ncbi:hypothetical protein BZA05DRAFT_29360 [Tricharina praecox]|uniref:uncharacterized protein n=1 Tax=Tricharina praecox TaxID=43433 RepID=UPI00221FA503|nr:uncharacterized protein BZA05DRAFT_29360 [Tricharina praecox]KAI5853445.1 hypothetical protein BZA05DRAFT_29360 [Tricharina praecox]